MRAPETASYTSMSSSRSRNAYRNTAIAPRSSAFEPIHIRWFRMRVISSNMVRMYWARSILPPLVGGLGLGLHQVGVVADGARYQHARLDRHRLVDHPLLHGVVAHLDIADQREVLAERMPHESVVGEDAAQIRMPVEDDAVQVECLALEPVRARPDQSQRRHQRQAVVFAEHAQAQAPVVSNRKQLDDGGKPTWQVFAARSLGPVEAPKGLAFDTTRKTRVRNRFSVPLDLAIAQVIDAAQVDQLTEGKCRLVAQRARHGQQVGRRQLGGSLVAYGTDAQGVAE